MGSDSGCVGGILSDDPVTTLWANLYRYPQTWGGEMEGEGGVGWALRRDGMREGGYSRGGVAGGRERSLAASVRMLACHIAAGEIEGAALRGETVEARPNPRTGRLAVNQSLLLHRWTGPLVTMCSLQRMAHSDHGCPKEGGLPPQLVVCDPCPVTNACVL